MTEIALAADTINTGITAAADIFFGTVGTFLITIGTDGGAVGTAFAAITDGLGTFAADVAAVTPAAAAHAILTIAAIGTDVACTVAALLHTAGTDISTIRAAFAAITDIDTFAANAAVFTPAAAVHAVFTIAAVGTEVTGAVGALLSTAGADIGTFRTAVSVVADHICTVDASLAAHAEIALAADAVDTGIAAAAHFILGTAGTFLITLETDGGTFVTAGAAVADIDTAAAQAAVFTPAIAADTADAIPAFDADVAGAVGTLLSAAGTDIGTEVAAVTTITDDGTGTAGAAVRTPHAVRTCTIFTDLATLLAKQNIFAVAAGLSTAVTEGGTSIAALSTNADLCTSSTDAAVIAELIVADTGGTFSAIFTDPIGTFHACSAAAVTDIFAVFTAVAAVFANLDTAHTQTAGVAEIFQTVGTVFAAILADLFGRTFAADLAAAVADVVALFAAAAAFVLTFAALVVDAVAAILTKDGAVAAGISTVFTDGSTAVAQLAGIAPAVGFQARLAVFAAIRAELIRGALRTYFRAAFTEVIGLFAAVFTFVVTVTAVLKALFAFVAFIILIVHAIAAVGAVPGFITIRTVAVFRAVFAAGADPVFGDPAAAVFAMEILLPGGLCLQRQTIRPGHFNGRREEMIFFIMGFFLMGMAVPTMDVDLWYAVEQHEKGQQDTEQFTGSFHHRFLLYARTLADP